MATIAGHLSADALRDGYVSSLDARLARHFQTIWLLAKGHSVAEVSRITSFGPRWIEQLAARYNAAGPDSLRDLRRRNGTSAIILKPELVNKLHERLQELPSDGRVWTSPKITVWMTQELGLEKVCPQRGWEALKALGWLIQTPQPKNRKSASPEEEAAFKKARGRHRRGNGKTS